MYSTYDISPYARTMDSTLDSSTGFFAVIGAMLGVYLVVILAIAVVQIIGMWKIYTKAGEKGWKSIIPIYNIVILFKIVGLSPWLIFAYLAVFIPFIGWIACLALTVYVCYCLAKSFDKDIGYAVGLWLLAPIFYMILGFGNAQYVGPYAKSKNVVVEPKQENANEDSE